MAVKPFSSAWPTGRTASWVLLAFLAGCFPSVVHGTPSKEEGLKFLEENKAKSGVVEQPSGLQYKVITKGEGKFHPARNAPCEVHYEGHLIDGTVFDSSYKRGMPANFAPTEVIKAWTEALTMMVEGDKWELYAPPQLAYGERGAGKNIPPGATLVFTVELIRIMGEKIDLDGKPVAKKPLDELYHDALQKRGFGEKEMEEETKKNLDKIKDMQALRDQHHHAMGIKAKMRNFSWNIFRYIGDYLHLFGIFMLFVTICKNKSVMGLSRTTQQIYVTIFCLRYLDLVDHSQTAYLVFFKVTYTLSTLIVLGLFQYMSSSYEAHKDTCSLVIIMVPCITAAFLLSDDYSFMEVAWTASQFLEGFAMVPQYVFCYRDKGARDPGVALFVVSLGGYRVFYVLNWIYKKVNVPQYSDVQSWIGGIIEVLFFIDFLNFRFTGHSMLRTVVLSVDEKVNEIQDKIELKVIGSTSKQRYEARQTQSGTELRRRAKPAAEGEV